MPHVFMLALEKLPHSILCFNRWAGFCPKCVKDVAGVESRGVFVDVETLNTTCRDVRK